MKWTRTSEDKRRHATQKQVVLEHLRSGRAIDQDTAQSLYRIRRLASRVSELKKDGFIVLSLRNQKGLATYLLLEAPTKGGDSND